MPYDLMEKVLGECAVLGVKEIIPSTMGEPFLYPHFKQMLLRIFQLKLKLNLTTNGTFPGSGVDYWSEYLLPVLSDVKFSVNSLDAITAGKIMGGIDVVAQKASIARFCGLRKYPVTVSLQVTAQRQNVQELPKILQWAMDLGVDRFKVNPFWVHHPDLEKESLQHSQSSRDLWKEAVETLQRMAQGHPIRLQGVESFARQSEIKRCPFLGREAWITETGEFRVCCHPGYEDGGFPDFGTLKTQTLQGVWESNAYRNFVEGYGEMDFCKRCEFRQLAL